MQKRNVFGHAILLLVLTFQITNLYSQHADIDLLLKYVQFRTAHTSFSYNIALYHKSFSSEDTVLNKAKVDLVRNESDTVLGGNISLHLDSIWYGYDGKHIMAGDFATSSLVLFDVNKYPNKYFLGSSLGDFIDKGFFSKSQGAIELYNDPTVLKIVIDSIVRGKQTRVFIFHLHDDNEIDNRIIEFAVDPATFHPVYRLYSAWFQENEQYTLWEFTNPVYHDNERIPELEPDFQSQFKIVSQYEEDTTMHEDTIQFEFGDLSGKILNEVDSMQIADVDADYIILDFWYTSCYPCIKSIPAVNRIAAKYAGPKINVFGVNPIDNEAKDSARLLKFMKNNPMVYKTIMLDKSVRTQLRLDGYPTFLILDRNLNVVYTDVGFNENLFEEVSAFLDSRL